MPEDDMPISVRNSPIPTPLATLTEAGMILTSHCRKPIRDRKRKMNPSMKTAVRASRYETGPVPWKPTTWYVKYALSPIPGLSQVRLIPKAKDGAYASATGRLVRKPNMIDPRPAMAAVAVMKSLFTPEIISTAPNQERKYSPTKQLLYWALLPHVGSTVSVQTHVAPL
jgi:hypothetical protein